MKTFSCHGCGGCCHGPIALTLDESRYRFFNDFPLVLAFVVSDVRNVPVEKEKSNYSKGMKKFTRDVIGFYHKSESDRKIVVHPQIMTLIPPDSPCVHLNEFNRCSIYSRKPSVCSLYPVRIDTPPSLIEEGLQRERNLAFEGEALIPCKGWDDNTSVFFSNGNPIDSETLPLLKSRNKEAKLTRDMMKDFYFFAKEKYDLNDRIEKFSQLNIATNQIIQLPYSLLILWMIDNNKIHPDIGKSLVEVQLEHLKSSLAINSSRKDDIGNTFNSIYEKHIEMIYKYIK